MKKYPVTIFLSLLFTIAFVQANIFSVQKTEHSSSGIVKSNTCFNNNFSYPDSEIEHCNTFGSPVLNVYRVFPNSICYLINASGSPAISSLCTSVIAAPGIETFDNNYLSHNYPSHNFW
jgi:hypothetical protein